MKTYKIALLGYYGFGNLGDELLLRSSIEILENVNIKREKIVVLSNNPAETSEVFKVKSVNRWKFSEVRAALKQSEFLVLGGGGLFQDTTSIRSCVWYWAVVKLARFLGLKVFAIGQSIGPLKFKISRILTGDALRACEKIHVRDENSFNIAKKFGCKNVDLGVDLVMLIKPVCTSLSSCDDISPQEGRLFAQCRPSLREGVSQSETEGCVLINLRPCKELEKYIDIIEPEIKKFNLRKIGVALSKDDEEILEPLREKLNLEKIIYVTNFNDAEKLWASSSCAVGMRLHFGVLSRIFKTPVVLIPYDIKVEEFAKSSGIPLIYDDWKSPAMPLEVPNVIKFDTWINAELTK